MYRQHNVKSDLVHVGIERVIEAMRSGVPVPVSQLGARSVEFYV